MYAVWFEHLSYRDPYEPESIDSFDVDVQLFRTPTPWAQSMFCLTLVPELVEASIPQRPIEVPLVSYLVASFWVLRAEEIEVRVFVYFEHLARLGHRDPYRPKLLECLGSTSIPEA